MGQISLQDQSCLLQDSVTQLLYNIKYNINKLSFSLLFNIIIFIYQICLTIMTCFVSWFLLPILELQFILNIITLLLHVLIFSNNLEEIFLLYSTNRVVQDGERNYFISSG